MIMLVRKRGDFSHPSDSGCDINAACCCSATVASLLSFLLPLAMMFLAAAFTALCNFSNCLFPYFLLRLFQFICIVDGSRVSIFRYSFTVIPYVIDIPKLQCAIIAFNLIDTIFI